MKNITILIACAVIVILAYSYVSSNKTKLNVSSVESSMNSSSTAVSLGDSTTSSTSSTSTILTATTSASGTIKNTNKKIMNATFKTNKGDITIELFDTKAPNTVANFRKLAEAGFYDGVKFHRVIKGFMIQSGDPLTKDDTKMDFWGTGGPGYKFADELSSDNHNDVGTISMANSGPNTNGSQFFINVNPNNFLDGKHVVFGKVIKGMDVVTAIESVQTGPSDRPVSPVIIEKITF